MLSIFPFLLTYKQLGPFLIRIVLGLTFAYFGYKMAKTEGKKYGINLYIYGTIQIILAIMLMVGLYTQLVAFILSIYLIIMLAYKIKNKTFLSNGINYYILLLAMSLSLLVTGAGFLAFDLPL